MNALLLEIAMALGLGFFFGLAFEEFHTHDGQVRPGGIRTFPLLALLGALLYRLDPEHLVAFMGGLLALGLWLSVYYWRHCSEIDDEGRPNVGLVVPICNVLAYALGPTAILGPPWLAIGATVAAVVLLTARNRLHELARKIELSEIVTAAKFLVLTGLVLPLLPTVPVTSLTPITPYQVWLAVLAVCTISYGSYLLQRYVAGARAGMWTALLGGLYSSTATTIVLARRAGADPQGRNQAQAGIVIATSVMYLRVLVIIAIFNLQLATVLAPMLCGLSGLGFALSGLLYWRSKTIVSASPAKIADNPLELTTALLFAATFVLVSLLSAWARMRFGIDGVYALSALIGFTDIDPFVLNLAQGGSAAMPVLPAAAAILIAASSNNVLKSAYTGVFSGFRASRAPIAGLIFLAAVSLGMALWIM